MEASGLQHSTYEYNRSTFDRAIFFPRNTFDLLQLKIYKYFIVNKKNKQKYKPM